MRYYEDNDQSKKDVSKYIPRGQFRYHYEGLNTLDKMAYHRLLWAFCRMDPRVLLLINQSHVSRVCQAIKADVPQIFYVRNYTVSAHGNEECQVNIYYKCTMNEAMATLESINKTVKKLCWNWKALLPVQKALAAHDWMCSNVTYGREDHPHSHEATAAFTSRITCCEGFAKSYKLLLDYLSIRSAVVCGEMKGGMFDEYGAHAWNLVWISGKVYHTDVTYDAAKGTRHCFLVNDKQLAGTHRWTEKWPTEKEAELSAAYRRFCNREVSVKKNDMLSANKKPEKEKIKLEFRKLLKRCVFYMMIGFFWIHIHKVLLPMKELVLEKARDGYKSSCELKDELKSAGIWEGIHSLGAGAGCWYNNSSFIQKACVLCAIVLLIIGLCHQHHMRQCSKRLREINRKRRWIMIKHFLHLN